MKHAELAESVAEINERVESESRAVLGFWIYIMTDCVLFASLFAVYAVLHKNTNGGPPGAYLFNLRNVLIETLLLLCSSFTCGLGMLAARRDDVSRVISWFSLTFILGASFLAIEFHEFNTLAASGNSWHRSGFLSAFFTLVATHGLHITIGLLWLATLLFKFKRNGLTPAGLRKLTLFSLFWHFLDLIWIFIFTIVYLFGAAGV